MHFEVCAAKTHQLAGALWCIDAMYVTCTFSIADERVECVRLLTFGELILQPTNVWGRHLLNSGPSQLHALLASKDMGLYDLLL